MAKKEKDKQVPQEEEKTVETAQAEEASVPSEAAQAPEQAPEVPETDPWEEKYNAERDAHLRIAA